MSSWMEICFYKMKQTSAEMSITYIQSTQREQPRLPGTGGTFTSGLSSTWSLTDVLRAPIMFRHHIHLCLYIFVDTVEAI